MARRLPSQQQGTAGNPKTFSEYAAGDRHYGTGRNAPNVGKTANKAGYNERDVRAEARRNALLARIAKGGR